MLFKRPLRERRAMGGGRTPMAKNKLVIAGPSKKTFIEQNIILN